MEAMEKAVFGTGCFWCTEAIFQRVPGVKSVVPGYAGGTKLNPTYEEVCTGTTGHAEVAEITYAPGIVSFEELLKVFWECHDPTTLNRQGADIGTQYRSVIFYTSESQRKASEDSKQSAQKLFKDTIVSAIEPLKNFSAAEDYHKKYFENNPNASYCRFVIKPKVDKFEARKTSNARENE
jgi:peptide-methionine (S)-S-oxide reductase